MNRACCLLILLLTACLPAPPVRADAIGPGSEPWAFTAPQPRQQQSLESASVSPAGLDREARAYYEAAIALLASNQVDQAATEIRRALVLVPDHPGVVSFAGRIYTRQQSFGLAANCWRQLLAAYPGSASLRAELGGALLYMGKEKEARTELEAALAASPGDITVRYYQALLHVKEREFDQAGQMFMPLTGPQVLQTIRRLQEDRDLIIGLSSTEGYRNLARALLGSKTGLEVEKELDKVKRLLTEAQPFLQADQPAQALPVLEAIQQIGARFPALEYDIWMCRYQIKPGPEPLDALEQLAASPRGIGTRRLFTYLCLSANEADRAERAMGKFLEADPDIEATLLRAAIRQAQDDEAGAWAILNGIPFAVRQATIPWFQRNLPAIQALRASTSFETWPKEDRRR